MDVWCNKTGDVQVARMELSSIDEIWSNQVRSFFFSSVIYSLGTSEHYIERRREKKKGLISAVTVVGRLSCRQINKGCSIYCGVELMSKIAARAHRVWR
jgi:hypothetical protein